MKTLTLTLAVVLSLGLGIGANTTVFVVQPSRRHPSPVPPTRSSLRAAIIQTREGRARSWSYPNYRDVRDRCDCSTSSLRTTWR